MALHLGRFAERERQAERISLHEEDYGDFELRLEAKLVGPGENAGIQFRSERIPNHHEVIGYQCDMGLAGGKSICGGSTTNRGGRSSWPPVTTHCCRRL